MLKGLVVQSVHCPGPGEVPQMLKACVVQSVQPHFCWTGTRGPGGVPQMLR